MHRDCLGNVYKTLPSRPPQHKAKPSKGGVRKIGRSHRVGEWRKLVRAREASHRAHGHKFTPYPC